jgi:hypothetical protein
MAEEKDSSADSAAPVAYAGYTHRSRFARRRLFHRLATCCADLDSVLAGLESALRDVEGHPDPALQGIRDELTLGRAKLANAARLAEQRR